MTSARHTVRTVVAIVGLTLLAALFGSLGAWQLRRADENRALAEQFAAGGAAPLADLPAALTDANRFHAVEVRGAYAAAPQFLLDNMLHDGVAGYHVLTVLRVEGLARRVIVNRGWIGGGSDRRTLPDVSASTEPRLITGRIERLPQPGIRLGEPPVLASVPMTESVAVVEYPTMAELAARLGQPLFDYQLLLDPAESGGYARDWQRPGRRPGAQSGLRRSVVAARGRCAGRCGRDRDPEREAAGVRHKSSVPWLVALAVFGPFGLAMLVYYSPWGRDWLPQLAGQRELLRTPVTLPGEWLEAEPGAPRWLLIYARMTPCEQQCAQVLDRLSRVQQALGKDQERVQRALWQAGEAPGLPPDPELRMQRLDQGPGRRVAAALGPERIGGGRVYLADPRGSVILSYPVGVEQKELLRDLKRLLAGSGTG